MLDRRRGDGMRPETRRAVPDPGKAVGWRITGRDTAPCRTRGMSPGSGRQGSAVSMPPSARPPEDEWHIAGTHAVGALPLCGADAEGDRSVRRHDLSA
jgi:hypothetical protein